MHQLRETALPKVVASGQLDGAADWLAYHQRWRLNAACSGRSLRTFFPGKGRQDVAARAKAICADCPVRLPCAEWAIPIEDLDGIYGGLTARQRRAIRSRRRRAQAAVDAA